MKIEVPDLTGAECGDIAITAAEGGIGYWSTIIGGYQYKRWSPDVFSDNIEVADDFVFYTIIDTPNRLWPDPEHPREYDITPVLIRRGFELAIDKAREDIVKRLLGLAREDWMGEIDATAADVIIQCGCFGEVVFS